MWILQCSAMLLMLFCCTVLFGGEKSGKKPFALGIIGLTHGHANLIFKFKQTNNVLIVGIAESDTAVVNKYKYKYNLADSLFFSTGKEMLEQVSPDGVAVFTSTFNHLKAIKLCASKGIDVMVEKPLATNWEQSRQIEQIAEESKIKVLTNYETTWHPSLDSCFSYVGSEGIGDIRKVVFHHGNYGPMNRAPREFTEWVTDSVQNGGGALMDFACYGINIITDFVNGQLPQSVYAELRAFKPDEYPEVDDEATIILNYKTFQCIVQASWNWAVPRKDMELYGTNGYAIATSSNEYKYKLNWRAKEEVCVLEKTNYPVDEPLEYFAGIISGREVLQTYDCASLENNLLVMQILQWAKESITTGKRIEIIKINK